MFITSFLSPHSDSPLTVARHRPLMTGVSGYNLMTRQTGPWANSPARSPGDYHITHRLRHRLVLIYPDVIKRSTNSPTDASENIKF